MPNAVEVVERFLLSERLEILHGREDNRHAVLCLPFIDDCLFGAQRRHDGVLLRANLYRPNPAVASVPLRLGTASRQVGATGSRKTEAMRSRHRRGSGSYACFTGLQYAQGEVFNAPSAMI